MTNDKIIAIFQLYLFVSGLTVGLYATNQGIEATQEAFNKHIVEADGIDTPTLTETIQTTSIDSVNFHFSIGKGDSMKPQITKCDLIIYDDTRFKEVDKGDIIAYEDKLNNRVVVHKYVGNNRAKGINNEHKDVMKVTSDNYKKKVYTVIEVDKNICQ